MDNLEEDQRGIFLFYVHYLKVNIDLITVKIYHRNEYYFPSMNPYKGIARVLKPCEFLFFFRKVNI